MTAATPACQRCNGFSLVELAAALAILAILASLAVPAWHGYLMRGWRAQARAALTASMLQLERHAVGAMTFAAALDAEAPAGEWPLPVPAAGTVRHLVTAAPCPQAALDACVELRAIPQQSDPECGVLILRSTGQWLSLPEGEAVARPLPAHC
ncbi:prepilin-type N-terminal cleavage/methylation domain-containing protein [Cupriavidus sp. UYPR2.512]|uniref:type IV pilin protein n=1 Tax=Cupriavidus sp. UYPR2.512 TaxID=1080187 RepID=UPI0003670816|nr:prepilin-type N-terminal cleavage/methylation domain-containing protein [Cupriavidus sp. UYPR2.512]UIF85393.1 prepilin-type N-terminal cleavage/methylation domain-containing protein [Cupriavidus necator]